MTTRKTVAAPPRSKPGTPGAGAAAAPVNGFEVQLSCPHCGGPFVASDATVSHTCAHCKSLLIIEAPDREEIFVEPATVFDKATILETLLQYRIDAHRSKIIASHSDKEGNPPSEFVITPLLMLFERRLRQNAKIVDLRPLHVPYRQTSGKILQATLGRQGEGAKVARLRAYTAEQTTPAYDADKFNLRDVGLRLGRSIFRPLRSVDVEKLGRFVPRSAASASRRELEKWRGQNLDAGFESVAKQGQVVVSFEATVYRPYFLVRAVLDRGDETLLFDGGFGTIAGYLNDEERDRFTRGKDPDPLGTKGETFRQVSIVPSRCPNCGADPKLHDDAVVSICVNCHAGVTPSAKGLMLVNYQREEGVTPKKDTALLPFWRFPFELTGAGPTPIRTLEAYAKALFPQSLPLGFAPQGDALYVPAWRLLTTEAGDKTFTDLARGLHGRVWNWTTDRIGLDVRPRFVPVSVPEDEARELAWSILFAIHSKASAARLNTLLLKQMLFGAKVAIGAGAVALLEFSPEDRLYVRPEATVPRLLIDGGPALSAQRVSVQAASSAVVASEVRPSASAKIRTSKYSPPQS